jgi:hypothetical protein
LRRWNITVEFVLSHIESFLSDFKRPLELYSFALFYLMILSTGTSALTASVFRVQIVQVRIFYGKTLYSTTFFGFPVHFCSIPTGASVELLSDSHNEGVERKAGYYTLEQVSRAKRLIIASSSLLGLGMLSILSLGMPDAFRQIASGLVQIVSGALDPCHTAHPLIRNFFILYDQSFLVALGVLCAKMISYALLPLAGNLTWSIGTIYAEKVLHRDVFYILFAIANVVLLFPWVFAFFIYSSGALNVLCQ